MPSPSHFQFAQPQIVHLHLTVTVGTRGHFEMPPRKTNEQCDRQFQYTHSISNFYFELMRCLDYYFFYFFLLSCSVFNSRAVSAFGYTVEHYRKKIPLSSPGERSPHEGRPVSASSTFANALPSIRGVISRVLFSPVHVRSRHRRLVRKAGCR